MRLLLGLAAFAVGFSIGWRSYFAAKAKREAERTLTDRNIELITRAWA